MARRDLVVVGASAGGVEALRQLAGDLPADFPAAVLIVLHLPSSAFSALPSILNRVGPLPAHTARDGMALEGGTVLVAPPDHHLLLHGSRVVLGRGPKENGHRPAIDPLFRSAARWHGSRVIGVVLSGALDDGAAGLWTIADRRGAAVVQEPETALYDSMPRAALNAVPDAHVVPIGELAKVLVELCNEEIEAPVHPVAPDLATEAAIAALEEAAFADPDRPGRPAAMTCPDCNGAMFEFDEGDLVRYRCRVGHAWSAESLLLQQVEAAETALWAAIRALEEKAALHRKIVRDMGKPSPLTETYHAERAAEAERSAAALRDMLRSPLTADAVGQAETDAKRQ
jgi:two-component system chemotaxis response regulator CheB